MIIRCFGFSNITQEQRTKADGTYKIAVGKDSSKSIETTNTNNRNKQIWK